MPNEVERVGVDQIEVDSNRVIAQQQRRLGQLLTELALKDALIEQLQEQMAERQDAQDAALAAAMRPEHNGRVTRPPRAKEAKK